MARTKKTSKRRKRLSRWLKGAIKWTSGSVALGAVVSLVVASFRWAESTDQFDLDSIRLSGNLYLGEEEILEWLELPTFATLDKMDLRAIQEKLESHPYVRAARASRDFPSALDITVVERIPIAYINRSPFYLVDEEGIILPVKNGSFEFDVPTLSGFNPSPELYPVGEKCLSQKVLEAVGYVAFINRVFPSLYNDLSEVRIDARDEYVLFLSQYPTKIYLGSTELPRRLELLQQFALTIRGLHSLHDYRYVDLRYEKQIVVRERA